jgi:RNA polymerase sigma factor (sigma-70 family)
MILPSKLELYKIFEDQFAGIVVNKAKTHKSFLNSIGWDIEDYTSYVKSKWLQVENKEFKTETLLHAFNMVHKYAYAALVENQNKAIRQINFSTETSETEQGSTTADAYENDEEKFETLYNAVKTLDANLQAVIIGRFFDGKTYKELAEQLCCSHEAVRKWERKALKTLRIRFPSL